MDDDTQEAPRTKQRMTNVEFVTELMEFSQCGALSQIFIIDAIMKHADAVAKADAEISARAGESEKRIAVIRDSATADARSVAREVTAELVRAFGGKADESAIDAAVDARLKEAA